LTEPTLRQKRLAVLFVFCCTLLGAAAQVLIKMNAGSLRIDTPVSFVSSLLHSWLLLLGFSLYGGSTVLLVLALRHGHLSLLYPVIALTFVWVTILSVMIFHDSMNGLKLTGIAIIVSGVAILGKGGAS
jgi:drug/metabolite transporter (DMT)-like permease